MPTVEKLFKEIMSGEKDNNIRFLDLQRVLDAKGLVLNRISGSHHIYSYDNVLELLDLQPDKKDHSKAKGYQVRQVRNFIKKYMEE